MVIEILRSEAKWSRRIAWIVQRAVEWIIIVALVWSLAAFVISWLPGLAHPVWFFQNGRIVLEDIFTIVVLLEIRDLLHTMSIPRLIDILATVLARKVILDTNSVGILWEVIGIVLLIMARAFWRRVVSSRDSATLLSDLGEKNSVKGISVGGAGETGESMM